MPSSTLKIDGAKFILTLDPQRRIIRDGSVLIEGQRITRIGKASDLAGVKADRVIDGREMVVTPGFCNGHMPISYAHATRGIFPDDLGPDYLPTVFILQSAMTEEVGRHVTDKPNPLDLPVYSTSEATRLMEEAIQKYDNRLDDRVRAWAMPFSGDFATRELLVSVGQGPGRQIPDGPDHSSQQWA